MPLHPTFPTGTRVVYRRENGVVLEYDVLRGGESEALRAIELDELFGCVTQNEAALLRLGVYQSMESEPCPACPVSYGWSLGSGLAAVRHFIRRFIEVVVGGESQ